MDDTGPLFRKQNVTSPQAPPRAQSPRSLCSPPQDNQELQFQQHISVLPVSERHTNGIISHVFYWCLAFFTQYFFGGWRWGEVHPCSAYSCRLFLLLLTRKIYWVSRPRRSSLCVVVELSQCCNHSVTKPHVFKFFGWCGLGSFQLVTVKEGVTGDIQVRVF